MVDRRAPLQKTLKDYGSRWAIDPSEASDRTVVCDDEAFGFKEQLAGLPAGIGL